MSRDGFAVSHCTAVMDSTGDGWGLLFSTWWLPGKSRRGIPRAALGPHCFFRGKSHSSVLGLWSSYGFPVSRPLGGSSRELADRG